MPSIKSRRLDGRTRAAKRARELEKAMSAELGGVPSDAKTAAIRRAAEMFVVCEEARTRWLAGDPSVTGSELATLDNALKRSLEYLGLSAKDVAAKAGPLDIRQGLAALGYQPPAVTDVPDEADDNLDEDEA